MQISIQAREFTLTEALQLHCERRLRLCLGSASSKVHSVRIQLSDENGPQGGIDKRCAIHANLRNLPQVIIVQDGTDLYVAIDRACDRVARAIYRKLERTRSDRRASSFLLRGENGAD